MEGTQRPSCDPETGECICRIGVTGIFCDECAPGYDSAFPACEECHPCTALWAENVTDVQRAAQRMRTFIPRHSDDLHPRDSGRRQHMLNMHSKLDSLSNLTGLSPPKVEKVEKLCAMIRYFKCTTLLLRQLCHHAADSHSVNSEHLNVLQYHFPLFPTFCGCHISKASHRGTLREKFRGLREKKLNHHKLQSQHQRCAHK